MKYIKTFENSNMYTIRYKYYNYSDIKEIIDTIEQLNILNIKYDIYYKKLNSKNIKEIEILLYIYLMNNITTPNFLYKFNISNYNTKYDVNYNMTQFMENITIEKLQILINSDKFNL